MGIGTSKLVEQPPPEKLYDFKKLAAAPEQYNIPEVPKGRQATDKYFLIIFIVNLILLLIFLAYTLAYADIERYTRGYDDCGNVCGRENEHVSGVPCSGKNFDNYTGFQLKNHRCFIWSLDSLFAPDDEQANGLEDDEEDIFLEFWQDISSGFGFLVLLITVTFVLCFVLLLLFRYYTAGVIWMTIIGCYGLLLITTISLWFMDEGTDNETNKRGGAIIMTIISIGVTIFLVAVFKRIPLVINIFREAVKAIFAMPFIILKPLLSSFLIFFVIMLFLITLAYTKTAGILTKVNDNLYRYEPNGAMLFTLMFDVIMVIWVIQFINACQVIVVSGAISSWYFARDKTFMGNPIKDSINNLVRFHMGTAAFGSLLYVLVVLLKILVKTLSSNTRVKALLSFCLSYFQTILAYVSNNAYILTALHGESFIKSGKRAIQLLYMNFRDMVAVNSIGDFVLFMAKLFVIVCVLIVGVLFLDGESDTNYFNVVILGVLLAIVIANSVFQLFEIAIDTIFLCYCEDCAINDGLERPYYMSSELRQFFEESKTVAFVTDLKE